MKKIAELKRETGKCMIYADRPFGCRTHFCEAAGGPFPRQQILDHIRRLEEVDRPLGGDGPRPRPAAAGGARRARLARLPGVVHRLGARQGRAGPQGAGGGAERRTARRAGVFTLSPWGRGW